MAQSKNNILHNLYNVNDNMGVLEQLLTEAIQKLDQVTSDLSDPSKYTPTSEINRQWINRSEVLKLMEAQALLEQCQNEISDIDKVSQELSDKSFNIVNKFKNRK